MKLLDVKKRIFWRRARLVKSIENLRLKAEKHSHDSDVKIYCERRSKELSAEIVAIDADIEAANALTE